MGSTNILPLVAGIVHHGRAGNGRLCGVLLYCEILPGVRKSPQPCARSADRSQMVKGIGTGFGGAPIIVAAEKQL